MPDSTPQSSSSPTPPASASGTAMTRPGSPGGLQTGQGQTTIADGVVTKIAGIAAREVGGVHRLGGGVARALGAVTQRLPVGDSSSQGVSVEVGDTEAAVDLVVIIEYGEAIPAVAQQVRDNVVRRIEGLTGLKVTQVNIAVNDLHFAGEDTDDADQTSRGA